MSMDKYGVEIDSEKEKTATKETKPTCPRCGSPLDNTSPPHCQNCGTEPFEQKKNPPSGTVSRQEAKCHNFKYLYGDGIDEGK